MLRAKPLETERQLGFSGLLDLFEDLSPHTFDTLPSPQRTALRAALLLDKHAHGGDPRAVAAGVRGVLQGLAAVRRVVLVIDDVVTIDRVTVRFDSRPTEAFEHLTHGASELRVAWQRADIGAVVSISD